jgi:signal peptidase I
MDKNIGQHLENDLPAEEAEKIELPTTEELEAQLERERYRFRYFKALRNTVFSLIVVAAVAVLIAMLWMPVLQIYGSSMAPQLTAGNIVLSRKAKDLEPGDVVAFYYNNKVLVKRMIGNPGDWIDIDKDGNVFINGELLEEPYVAEKALGDCDIDLPYQVPENKIFVMGDHRSVSIDSRNSSVGCIETDQIVGKLVFKIWPIGDIGIVK